MSSHATTPAPASIIFQGIFNPAVLTSTATIYFDKKYEWI